jgi:pimeloyl-ACP methyl ester carboxylesterase
MSSRCRLLLALAVALGRGAAMRAQSPAAAPAPEAGTIFVVGGIGGWDPLGRSTKLVCPVAGVPHRVVDFFWSHGVGRSLRDLMDTPHLARKAEELAALILETKQAAPERPIYLVAKSGGTGLALLATERLPPNTLERVILVSAAVRPDYDLRPALRATRREVVSFYSKHDRLILGWGTRTFGTVDRIHCASAGKVGFRLPEDFDEEDRALYQRVVQVSWRPGMLLLGYAGGHHCNSWPLFTLVELAPWLR